MFRTELQHAYNVLLILNKAHDGESGEAMG